MGDPQNKETTDTAEAIRWQKSIAIFKNALILRQLALAIGIPFGLIALIIGLSSGKSIYTVYALGLIAAFFFLTWLLIMLVYRGKYEVEFVLDDKGVLSRTQAKQAKKNRIINAITIVAGVASRNASAAGAGFLAQTKESVFIRWDKVQKVKYKPHSYTIMLRGGPMEQIALFCGEDNYERIEAFVKERILKIEN